MFIKSLTTVINLKTIAHIAVREWIRRKTMTNYEKIKQMSIDEMARSRMFFFDCPYGTPCVGCSKGKEFNNNCTDCTKHWLESEVEE